jgi:hypothetical protein
VSTLDKYISELAGDTTLDEFTLKDVQMKLPAIKHKWAGRLIRSKIDLNYLRKKRNKTLNDMATRLITESPVKISRPLAKQKVEEHEAIIEIDECINEQKAVIEFLEKAERILNSMTFDIKNLTEIMKLETQ